MVHVYDASPRHVSRVEETGCVYDLHATLIGYVDQDGRVTTFGAQGADAADLRGRLFDAVGQLVGVVGLDGAVCTWSGQYMGYIESGEEMAMGLKASAALLLLPVLP